MFRRRPEGGMPRVGLVANPSSGHDLRRLVSSAETVTHLVKVNRITRVLAGLRALGPCRVLYMPERLGLVPQAFSALTPLPEAPEGLPKGLEVEPLPLKTSGTPNDTLEATRLLREAGCELLITFGGDGTNRLVALEAHSVPLLPLSAGTNNIFPLTVEATQAGVAAATFLALKHSGYIVQSLTPRHKLLLARTEDWEETALVDLAISRQARIGGRAVWKADDLRAVFVTRCTPGASGLCGIPGAVLEIPPLAPQGVAVMMGQRFAVQAVLTAGVVQSVPLESVEPLHVGEVRTIEVSEGTVLVDGERVRELKGEELEVELVAEGPCVLEVERTLQVGQQRELFLHPLP